MECERREAGDDGADEAIDAQSAGKAVVSDQNPLKRDEMLGIHLVVTRRWASIIYFHAGGVNETPGLLRLNLGDRKCAGTLAMLSCGTLD